MRCNHFDEDVLHSIIDDKIKNKNYTIESWQYNPSECAYSSISNKKYIVVPETYDFDIKVTVSKMEVENFMNDKNAKSNKKITFKDMLDEMLETYIIKNNDYGNSFDKSLDEFGITASLVRMEDKLNRLKTLTKNNEQKVKDESIQDTLLDLANYSAMTCLYLRNKINRGVKDEN